MGKKILVTGATGQVGRSIKQAMERYPQFEGYFEDRNTFDLSDESMMRARFDNIQPDLVINTAAYTQVDKAEEDEIGAHLVNTKACAILAELCKTSDITLIHYSTDYVYHNGLDRPLKEIDDLNPQSVYGRTKLQGEDAIRSVLKAYFTIRTSWVYDAHGSNFVRTMLNLAEKHPQLTVVDDQIGSPTYAPDIADMTLALAEKILTRRISDEQFGTYNFSNEGVCSWYDFAHAIFNLSNIDIPVKPVDSSAFPRPASRPHYSVMDKSKIRSLLTDYDIPYWRESLKACLKLISC